MTRSESVSDPDQCQRMLLLCPVLAHTLLNMAPGDGTVGTNVIGAGCGHLLEHRLADLHGIGEVLAFDSPRAIMTGATLHHAHLGSGNHLQHVLRLLTDILHP